MSTWEVVGVVISFIGLVATGLMLAAGYVPPDGVADVPASHIGYFNLAAGIAVGALLPIPVSRIFIAFKYRGAEPEEAEDDR